MKTHQLIVTPFNCDMDAADWQHDAKTPNPVFATLEGAKAAAQVDLDSAKDDMEEPDALMTRTPLMWFEHDDGHLFALDEEAALIYAIHELELGA